MLHGLVVNGPVHVCAELRREHTALLREGDGEDSQASRVPASKGALKISARFRLSL